MYARKHIAGLLLTLVLAAPAQAQLQVEIQLVSSTLVSNNHVGNEWSIAAYAGLRG